jgi:hypothetical protein
MKTPIRSRRFSFEFFFFNYRHNNNEKKKKVYNKVNHILVSLILHAIHLFLSFFCFLVFFWFFFLQISLLMNFDAC